VAATRLTKLRRGELAFEDHGQPTLDEGFRGLRAMSKRQEELVTPHLRASFCVVAPPNFTKRHQLESGIACVQPGRQRPRVLPARPHPVDAGVIARHERELIGIHYASTSIDTSRPLLGGSPAEPVGGCL